MASQHGEHGDGGQGPAAGPSPLMDMLSAPLVAIQQMERLNTNMERLAPLAEAIERINPEDIQTLTRALEEATRTGQSLLNKLK